MSANSSARCAYRRWSFTRCRFSAFRPPSREIALKNRCAEPLGLESDNHLLLGREPASQVFVDAVREFCIAADAQAASDGRQAFDRTMRWTIAATCESGAAIWPRKIALTSGSSSSARRMKAA